MRITLTTRPRRATRSLLLAPEVAIVRVAMALIRMTARRVKASLHFLCLLSLVALSLVAVRSDGLEKADEDAEYNLLFVSIDTLRADHLSSYGYARETSPNLDALAARSQRFENAWSVMPTTLPSHTAMFTSLYPSLVGVEANGSRVDPSAHTLAERLAERGFTTGAFISAPTLDPEFGLDQGFGTYDSAAGKRRGDETRERASAWLREHRDERLFLFVHLFDPHTWYDAPTAQLKMFRAPPGPLPPERSFLTGQDQLGPAQRTAITAAYDAEIRFADEQLGRLLSELENLGLDDSTLVVVTSDHGETLDELIDTYAYGYDHGEFLHRRELNVPLIIYVPGKDVEGRVHAEPVTSLRSHANAPRAARSAGRRACSRAFASSATGRPEFAAEACVLAKACAEAARGECAGQSIPFGRRVLGRHGGLVFR